MTSRRFWGFLLVGLFFVLVSMSMRGATTVEADNLLQNVPRLDGKKIYFTEGNGEPSRFDRTDAGLSRFAGLISQLGASMDTLEWRTGFPDDADLIVIAGPVSDLAPDQIARLWIYLNNHGRLLLLSNPIGDNRTAAFPVTGGLFTLTWSDMGIRARNDVVAMEGTAPIYATPTPESTADAAATEAATDAAATDSATVAATEFAAPNSEAEATETQPAIIGERPILITTFSTDQFDKTSPITQDLDGPLTFFTARSLEVDASIQGYSVTPLVFSPSTFYGETAYAQYLKDGSFGFAIGADTARGPLPLAASYSNEQTGARAVIIGDREFAVNGDGMNTSPPNSAAFLYPNNARFLINAVTWLLDQESVQVEFPTPGPTATVTITPSITPTRTPTLEATKAETVEPSATPSSSSIVAPTLANTAEATANS
jgi:hypothetical protein